MTDQIRQLVKAGNSWDALRKAKEKMAEIGYDISKWDAREIIPMPADNLYVVKFETLEG